MVEHWTLPARVLCLDGGGVRGLSSLMILEAIMNTIADDENADVDSLRPCDYFDLICGTSTGELIAILLGRLRLTVKEAMDTYIELSKHIFSTDRSVPIFGGLRAAKGGRGRFDAQILKEKIQETVGQYCGGNGDERMYDLDTANVARGHRPCHVAVLAVFADRLNSSQPHLFRSYDRNERNTIWEAARATSAAPTFFDAIEIGSPPVTYVDAGLGYNNPAEVVFDEVHTRWPNRRIGVFVSLGTGKESGIALTREASRFGFRKQADLVDAMIKMTTSATRTHDQMWKRFSTYQTASVEPSGVPVYFRFNVDEGLHEIGLQEWKRIGELAGKTRAYLNQAQIGADKTNCANRVRRLSRRAKPFELGSKAFHAVHEDDVDTDHRCMRYWYRETLAESGYPAEVQIDDEFKSSSICAVGDEILSLRRICNLVVRGEAFGITPGKYRVRWTLWFRAGRNHPPTHQGLLSGFTPEPAAENSIYQRSFPSTRPDLPAPNPDSGFFHPWNLRLSVGRAKTTQHFMQTGIDRHQHRNAPGFLLQPGYREQVIDAGLWGTMKNTGWAEARDVVVDVEQDGHLAFVMSLDWPTPPESPRWYGGLAFGGVRLDAVSE